MQSGRAAVCIGSRALAATAIAGLLVAFGPTPTSADIATSTGGDITQAIAFRTAFGLNASPTYVARLLAEGGNNAEWGVPLTADEAADLDHRASVAREKVAVEGDLELDPAFAGLYTDQVRGGVIVVRLTRITDATLSTISKEMPLDAKWEIEPATFTMAELEAKQDDISASHDELSDSGVKVSWVSVDPIKNRVHVGIDPYDPKTAAALTQKFGPMVDVAFEPMAEETACTTRDACDAPFRGGVHISSSPSPFTTVNCTSGFMSRRLSGGVAGEWYMMTAGHCISNAGGLDQTWKEGSAEEPVGRSGSFAWANNISADVGVIKVTTIDFPTNYVYGDIYIDTITTSVAGSGQAVGDPICRGAWKSNWTCGTVSSTNHDVTLSGSPGYTIHHQWSANFGGQTGDSGAPMIISAHNAMGIMSTVTGSTSNYGVMDYIFTQIAYRPCYTQYSNPCG